MYYLFNNIAHFLSIILLYVHYATFLGLAYKYFKNKHAGQEIRPNLMLKLSKELTVYTNIKHGGNLCKLLYKLGIDIIFYKIWSCGRFTMKTVHKYTIINNEIFVQNGFDFVIFLNEVSLIHATFRCQNNISVDLFVLQIILQMSFLSGKNAQTFWQGTRDGNDTCHIFLNKSETTTQC